MPSPGSNWWLAPSTPSAVEPQDRQLSFSTPSQLAASNTTCEQKTPHGINTATESTPPGKHLRPLVSSQRSFRSSQATPSASGDFSENSPEDSSGDSSGQWWLRWHFLGSDFPCLRCLRSLHLSGTRIEKLAALKEMKLGQMMVCQLPLTRKVKKQISIATSVGASNAAAAACSGASSNVSYLCLCSSCILHSSRSLPLLPLRMLMYT